MNFIESLKNVARKIASKTRLTSTKASAVKLITREQWMGILLNMGLDMRKKGTTYGWKKPITYANALKQSTCVTYISAGLQKAGYLPSGYYIHYSNGKLSGNGAKYVKQHPELFTIINAKATPQKLGTGLQRGDICLYSVPHIMAYSGKNESGSPKWYSLERGSGGYGKKAKLTLSGVFGYYTKRRIEIIIRPKFSDSNKTPSTVLPTKYRTKMAMNVRSAGNGKADILYKVPKGADVTVIKSVKGSSWKHIRYNGKDGYMNCASKYVTRIQ